MIMPPKQPLRGYSVYPVIQNNMCETIKPSSWDQGGILRDIFTITRTIDNAVDAVLDSPAKKS
jgi:hypothetical protein